LRFLFSVRFRLWAFCLGLFVLLVVSNLTLHRFIRLNDGGEGLQTAILLTSGAAILALLLLWFIARQVMLPLQLMAEALRRLNAGEHDVRMPPVSADEFGDMAIALRHFREHALKLDYLAYTDSLTDLPNRARLEKTLQRALPEHEVAQQSLALLFLDLDHFKSVNDSLGHRAGDQYLREATARLHKLVPPGATVHRYSGDEFAIVLPHQADDARLPSRLAEAAERLRAGMASGCTVGGHALAMSASIGVALFPQDVGGMDELISNADAAMFLAKRDGRNQVRFATRELTTTLRRRALLAGDIRRGIDAGEFDAFYQAIVNVATQRVDGAEALLRWRHPQRGLVMPGEFIPAAEETGTIAALGAACLDRACAQAARCAAAGRELRIAVNLSMHQLRGNELVQEVLDTLQRHRVQPSQLEFEITESVVMDQAEHSERVLARLRELGISLTIDDFGTGYSSLSYLQRFPIQRIKIDRSFVARIGASREAEAIVGATLAMARSLNLEAVAEGVETVAQMRRMLELGCPLQQGFLFTPALPGPEFEYWLEGAQQQLEALAAA